MPPGSVFFTDAQKIGVGLTAFGVFFMLLGIVLFFDSGLLAIGNILFLSGITLIIGFTSTIQFFFRRRDKLRGTLAFFVGIFMVFVRWPITGMFVELMGFVNLFGDFFPVVLNFLRRLPVIGTILNLPGISPLMDRLAGGRKLPV
ncbi:Got1-domain-containing protein [Gonapodya prolifera JEL478]|uniref:Got1-domain-containing protein n=1 Tax=Gonapodya prolifera (strain JEL478) TaxID=1344416 RepID=A0A139B018_GONPJ|nr:Got1-domain-containing protein [Gonapodya prolifera JEL478]|eukprot:KXS22307.1 Got1-domain-containing protein [Gonapodya prolifera JEL478]